ncbi:hypothetical protein F9Y90_01475 [Borrelia miyamotoi]|uniref:Uncharacterized protein n=1 Tax=Borrelia miyamotoi TaxID=47466 RepID=A0AAX3JL95_9SPIR|nr:hypothetical protein [Borrelia miyamotoi]QFP41798.1 hypothetical protein F9Y90_01475 [Borrelia miyamotoi]QFP47918.1 hypothetical protein F9Y91_01470 [Borrelia miyamotoi]QGT55678.1 hypothetical protein GNY89_01480 [Borrelia miyamotoi]QGT56461.1 hypothetical protein GNY88_01480 [Borrelia miyamotoi]WAZ71707.1 hypothetical protein O5404_01485 [Borrelia miyamotoi]
MILISFNLNGESLSKSVKLPLSTRELLINIFCSSERNLIEKMNKNFFLVLLDSKPVYSFLVPAFMLNGRSIITIEGLRNTTFYEALVKVLLENDFGFCANCFSSNALLFYYFLKRKVIIRTDILGYYNTLKCHCVDVNTFLELYLRLEELERK